jgi:hypothetical protein
MTLGNTRARLEREAIVDAMQAADGDRARAAAVLGIAAETLRIRLRTYGLTPRGVPLGPRIRAAARRRTRPAPAPRFVRVGRWTWVAST